MSLGLGVLLLGCGSGPDAKSRTDSAAPVTEGQDTGLAQDSADSGETDGATLATDCSEGAPRVVFQGEDEDSDLTETFLAGTPEASVGVVLPQPGTLWICPGEWWVSLRIEADVSVIASEGPEVTVLDAVGAAAVVQVSGAHSVSLEGLTLRGGLAQHGGGLYATNGATVALLDCLLTGNRVEVDGHGGGMCLSEGSEATLSEVRFVDNAASEGGGMAIMNSHATLTGVTFEANAAAGEALPGYGGGLFLEGSTAALEDIAFVGNQAVASGGGMAVWYESAVTLAEVQLTDNAAGDDGGGLHLLFGEVEGAGVVLSGNAAGGQGGNLALKYSDLSLTESRVLGGVSESGAGSALYTSSVALDRVSFEGNAAESVGGGLYLEEASSAEATGCSFSDNTPEDLYIEGNGPYSWGSDASFRCDAAGCK